MRGTALSRERACWNECEELSGDVIARTSVWNFRAEVVIWKQHRALYIYTPRELAFPACSALWAFPYPIISAYWGEATQLRWYLAVVQ